MVLCHVLAQRSISMEEVLCLRVTNAACPGCQPLKVGMQGLISARKQVTAHKELWTPLWLVPQLVKDAGPVGPVRGVGVYPGGDDNLHRACNVVSLLSDASTDRLEAAKLSADLRELNSIGRIPHQTCCGSEIEADV